jgi:16S rRNA processing protein RimM
VALVRIGKVVRAVGLKGHLGVGGSEGALAELERVALRLGEGEPETRRIEEARPQGRIWAVKLEGVSGRTAAEALVGAEVLAVREELGDAGEGRHLWADLEGVGW